MAAATIPLGAIQPGACRQAGGEVRAVRMAPVSAMTRPSFGSASTGNGSLCQKVVERLVFHIYFGPLRSLDHQFFSKVSLCESKSAIQFERH